MPLGERTLVMKFGGAALQTPAHFHALAQRIREKRQTYDRLVIVVSAMGGMTDHLIGLARQVHPVPPRREYDMLVSAGERISIALLAMALSAQGMEAVSFTGSQSGIVTSNEHGEARIVDVRPGRLLPPLLAGHCVIVAGFQGVSLQKEITTLGRGGSDTSAVALGVALRAERVEFYKDVEGICAEDPKHVPTSTCYAKMGYEEALEVVQRTGGKVLHPRALSLARINCLPLTVLPFYQEGAPGTEISGSSLRPEAPIYEGESTLVS